MNELRKLARQLNLINYRTDQIYYEYERKHCINDSEICLMYALDDGKSHSQKQICEDWHIPKTTLNTIIKQWERLGYIELKCIPGKRREREITLTEIGENYIQGYLTPIYKAEQTAIKETLEKFPNFIEASMYYENLLRVSFSKEEV